MKLADAIKKYHRQALNEMPMPPKDHGGPPKDEPEPRDDEHEKGYDDDQEDHDHPDHPEDERDHEDDQGDRGEAPPEGEEESERQEPAHPSHHTGYKVPPPDHDSTDDSAGQPAPSYNENYDDEAHRQDVGRRMYHVHQSLSTLHDLTRPGGHLHRALRRHGHNTEWIDAMHNHVTQARAHAENGPPAHAYKHEISDRPAPAKPESEVQKGWAHWARHAHEDVELDENEYHDFLGVGNHVWNVNYDHGRWKGKNTTVQTKDKSEDAVRKHRAFVGKKGVKINSISYRGIRQAPKEDVNLLDEARRGRPRKYSAAAGEDEGGSPDDHIIMQLRKVVTLRGAKPVTFADKKQHKIDTGMAQSALQRHGMLRRPEQRAEFEKRLGASHHSFKSALKLESVEEVEEWLDEGKKFSTKDYLHPLDFPNHSPLHDTFVKHGLEHVKTSSRVVSPADGIENHYHYEGSSEAAEKVRSALDKHGLERFRNDPKGYTSHHSRKHGLVGVHTESGKTVVGHSLSG